MDVITIDGPAGAGKSTISKMVAQRMGYSRLDTGAMYRAVAWLLREKGVELDDTDAVDRVCARCKIEFRGDRILIDNIDVTGLIRTPEIDMLASRVSAIPCVRQHLARMQRALGEAGEYVAEGRDMGTVVFPQADFKFFLTASPEVRAERRKKQLDESGEIVLYATILRQIMERDTADSSRAVSPLQPADDATVIDSSEMSPEEVVELILAEIRRKKEKR